MDKTDLFCLDSSVYCTFRHIIYISPKVRAYFLLKLRVLGDRHLKEMPKPVFLLENIAMSFVLC